MVSRSFAIPWRSRTCSFAIFLSVILLYIFLDVSLRSNHSLASLEPGQSLENSDDNHHVVSAGPPPAILLVSAFFPITTTRHSMRDYSASIQRFLGSITTDIYFFTTPEMAPIVRELRGDLPITINTTFASPFDIPPSSYLEKKYYEMHAMDREKNTHTPELYAVWNGKPYFLDEAVRNCGKAYDYAFWNDAGSFQAGHKYGAWPDARRVEQIWEEGTKISEMSKDELLFFPMFDTPHSSIRFWEESMGPVDHEFSQGTFFGGAPKAISWWRDTFYTYHDAYIAQRLFVGNDRTLTNALLLLFPSRILTVWLADADAPAHKALLPLIDEGPLGSCGSATEEFVYHQFWMADAEGRRGMRRGWDRKARWRWDWWRMRKSCRVTRVLGMMDVLRRRFGVGWNPPKASLGSDR